MLTYWFNENTNINENLVLDRCANRKPDRIVLLGDLEWEMPLLSQKLISYCKNNNIKLIIVHGASKCEYYEKLYEGYDFDINDVRFFDIQWLLNTEQKISWRMDYKNYQPQDFIYPYICLNNRAHLHRCAIIDELAGQQLLDKGIVTWHKFLNENKNYPFKYYNNAIRKLNDNFEDELDSFLIPDEFHKSFLHVIAEASHKAAFITEKTAIPTLLKKPYLVLSCKHWYKNLTRLGFVLYDELFDYSFDEVDDLHMRTKLLVKNVHNIIDKNYKELYQLLLPKLEHNYNRLLELKTEPSMIPDVVHEYVQNLKDLALRCEGGQSRIWSMVDEATQSHASVP